MNTNFENTERSSITSNPGHRVFYSLPDKPKDDDANYDIFNQTADNFNNVGNEANKADPSAETYYTELFSYIENNIIGRDKIFKSPFGDRNIVYCDYTASGRSLKFIEEFIFNEVLPEYANTHTTNTVTSLQTTMFRHEARDIIRNSCQASEHDAVLFVGSGCTGAIHKLIHNLNLNKPPIVIVGPFEHHSNLLPWRHLAVSVHRVGISKDGSINIDELQQMLQQHSATAAKENRPLLAAFSAVSNVTGIVTNVNKISAMVHRAGGIVFWDYAAGAAYLPIDMNPIVSGPDREYVYKDAVYFSMHKFIGGVQAPGILIAKKAIFTSGESYPDGTGGGTVFFVRRENQVYLKDVEEREEGGTPDILGSIRAGLAFQLKDAATTDAIIKRENYLVKLAWSKFTNCSPSLVILGGNKTHRLPIFSFLIRHEMESPNKFLFLHHNFVCSLLNDLFGIQARSGCACAGPYAMDLIGIDEELAKKYEGALIGSGLDQTVLSKYFEYPHREIVRPGFVRINLPYFMPDVEVRYVLDAIRFISRHGWKFLPLYKFNPVTSDWRHRQHEVFRDRKWLGHVSYKRGYMTWRRPNRRAQQESTPNFNDSMKDAKEIMEQTVNNPVDLPDESSSFADDLGELRWFMLPCEAATILWNAPSAVRPSVAPFLPGSIVAAFFGQAGQSSPNNANDAKFPLPPSSSGNTSSNSKQPSNKAQSFDNPVVEVVESFKPINLSVKFTKDNNGINHSNSLMTNGHNSYQTEQFICPLKTTKPKSNVLNNKKSNSLAIYKVTKRNQLQLWKCPPKQLFKPIVSAINDFDMIRANDRILICLSGGKDSLSMLHCLRQYQLSVRKQFSFELGAVTVDPGSSSYNPSGLIPYLASLNIPYFYERQPIIDQAKDLPYDCESICSFCSRMKRGRIYACARLNGYNVIALGQHLDDLCESFLMSCFHNGLLRTMKAHYTIEQGDIRVIRPLVYCREKFTRSFADQAKLPVIPENCPGCFEAPKERFRVKMVLAEQELQFPNLYNSLLKALRPIMGINCPEINLIQLLNSALHPNLVENILQQKSQNNNNGENNSTFSNLTNNNDNNNIKENDEL